MANQPRRPRLPERLIRELFDTDWRLEMGRKHWHLLIDGKLVGVLPKGRMKASDSAALYNTLAQVRRAKAA